MMNTTTTPDAVTHDKEYFSLGRAAQHLQRTPQAIREAMAALGLTVAYRVNGTGFVTGECLQRLSDHFHPEQASHDRGDNR